MKSSNVDFIWNGRKVRVKQMSTTIIIILLSFMLSNAVFMLFRIMQAEGSWGLNGFISLFIILVFTPIGLDMVNNIVIKFKHINRV